MEGLPILIWRVRIVKALGITSILLSDCSRERTHTHLGSWVIDTTTTEFTLGYKILYRLELDYWYTIWIYEKPDMPRQ